MKLTIRKTSAAIAGLLLVSSLSVPTAYATTWHDNGCFKGEFGCTTPGVVADGLFKLASQNALNRSSLNPTVNTQNAY